MITVYATQDSPRLRFTLEFIFNELILIPFQLVLPTDQFDKNQVHISYSKEPISPNCIHILPTSLLFENGIVEQRLLIDEVNGIPVIYGSSNANFPFDIFSAVFFLLVRYEEYLPHKQDKHHRFAPEQSFAFKNGILERPIIDEWCIYLKQTLASKYVHLDFGIRKFKHVVTVDVDTAYAFKGKGAIRTFGALLKDLISLNFSQATDRVKTVLGFQKDPYDIFEWLLEKKKQFDFKLILFYLLADYDLNDKNIPHQSIEFRSLIKHLNDYSISGIHPSYASSSSFEKIKIEKSRLQEITHMPITKSRQHFLKIHLPQSYRALLHADLTDDFSMAYASIPGFRSGTCTPHKFYDLDLNQPTGLTVHPFPIMEATYKYYLNENPLDALEKMKVIVDSVKQVNGTLYSTWHNNLLSNYNDPENWQSVFTGLLNYIHGKS